MHRMNQEALYRLSQLEHEHRIKQTGRRAHRLVTERER
jgi:hypothetical protein